MTTATRTLDLFCPALSPGPGLKQGQNKLSYLLIFSIEHKKCFYYGNMQIMRKHFLFQKDPPRPGNNSKCSGLTRLAWDFLNVLIDFHHHHPTIQHSRLLRTSRQQ